MTLPLRAPAETFRDGTMPVIETARLVLRAPRIDDAPAIAALAQDRRVAENTARIPHPYSREDAEGFVAAANTRPGEETFAVTRAGIVIGTCGLDLRDDVAPEIGYWLGVPFWGKGYGSEAVRALIDHAFGERDYAALVAGARVSNPASRRVLEKCGFAWTGVTLLRVRAINSSTPCDRFRLEREAWLAQTGRAKGQRD